MRTASILLVCVAFGCASSDSPAAGEAAGKVIQLAGAVKAERKGESRDLTMDSKVYADDVITTLPGASVSIELFHNSARWTIAPGKTRKVDESIAWRAAKQTKAALARSDTDRSAAAGRSAERSSANTAATAMAPSAPTSGAPAAASDPAPKREAKSRSRRRSKSGKVTKEIAELFVSEGEGRSGPGSDIEKVAREVRRPKDIAGGKRAKPAPGGAAVRGPAPGPKITTRGRSVLPKGSGTVTIGRVSVTAGLTKAVIERIARARLGTWRACYERALRKHPTLHGALTLTIYINAAGRVTRAKVSGASKSLATPELTGCLIGRARALAFPAPREDKTPVAAIVLSFKRRN